MQEKGRPFKDGLDYYPLDVNFFENDKIKLIEAEFGIKGTYVALRLLNKIYREKGYYYKWGDDECLLLAGAIGVSKELVAEIVRGLVKRSFFDKRVFDSFQVLTSCGIQDCFLKAVERRKLIIFEQEYLCIDVENLKNVYIKSINDDIKSINVDIKGQSKVEDNNKISNKKNENSEVLHLNGFVPPTLEEVQKAAELMGKQRNFFESWLAEEVALIFYNHSKAKEWKNNDGLYMRNWYAYVQNEMIKAVRIEHQKKANNTNGNGNRKNYTKTTASSGTRIVEGDAINEGRIRAGSTRTFQG